ncbi:uncharacterized protein LOC142167322 [Nicotiana tabacum]|uniref:Uncharacterized protein LOC142167322 n=1 Tax=Nicotiana tabacum TaxID=4097 RepID=A0AC58SF37_TOBAC
MAIGKGTRDDSVLCHNHPLYLPHPDLPGENLIEFKLLGTENYNFWCRSMRIGLFMKNKIGFIDGTCRKENFKKDLHDQWERCSAFVLSYIMNAVTKKLYSSVVYVSSTHNVWKDLKERFDEKNISRFYNLLQEIAALKQGLSLVSTYYSKPKDPRDEYDAMTPTPPCPCPVSKVFLEHIQQYRLVQFLSGMNKSFAHAKGQIILMIPTPTINETYGMVVQDESQRAKTVSGLEMGAATVTYNTEQGFTSGYKQKSRVQYLLRHQHMQRLQDICSGNVKAIGKLEEGLYVLDLMNKLDLKLPICVITSALISGGLPTFDSKRYFLTLVDDFSRYTWICLMNINDESIVVLKHFISLLRNKFSTTPKTLRTDNE